MTSMNTANPDNEAPIPVPLYVRDMLLALAYGWTPAPVIMGPVERLQYNGKDFSELAPTVQLQSDKLIVTLGGPRFYARHGDLIPFVMDGQVNGTCADGTTFHGDMILRVTYQGDSVPQNAGPWASMAIEAASWAMLAGETPSLWIGRIEGGRQITFGGNMIIERVAADGPRLGRRGHFRLSGAYTYYLIQSGVRSDPVWHLLIDTGAGMPDAEMLASDFLLLQFVLGRQLRMPELLGVTPERRTVASMTGTGARENLEKHAIPPVPIERNNSEWVDESWVTVLFERVSAAWTARPESRTAYYMAFNSYLDAMTLHLDADYLRLQIALEGFAYWSLRIAGQEERMVVKDKAAWKKWVKDNEGAIRTLAAPGFENSLFDKVMGVYRLSSGRVVPSAFRVHDTELLPEMVAELGGRDTIVHQGIMASDGYDAEGLLRRLAIIRTMLVALIAKVAGYAGAINGWEVRNMGYPLEPQTWWRISNDDRSLAQRSFIAEEVVST